MRCRRHLMLLNCFTLLACALAATAQTNQPSRPSQPIQLMTKVGECESRIGNVEVMVSATVESGKSALRIQCRLNHADTACAIDSSNALSLAQVVQTVASDLMQGKPSTVREKNIEVAAFELEGRKLVEIEFYRGDPISGQSICSLWFDPYNALNLSRLITSAKTQADWLEPRMLPLE